MPRDCAAMRSKRLGSPGTGKERPLDRADGQRGRAALSGPRSDQERSNAALKRRSSTVLPGIILSRLLAMTAWGRRRQLIFS
jgi:hypothetical protein